MPGWEPKNTFHRGKSMRDKASKDPEEALKTNCLQGFEHERKALSFDGGLHYHAIKHISVLIACTVPLSSASPESTLRPLLIDHVSDATRKPHF